MAKKSDKVAVKEDPEADSDKDLLKQGLEAFELADEAEHDMREAWLKDTKFARLAEQWPEDVKRQREKDGRPCLTINKLPSFIRQVTNDARQNRPSIKTIPASEDASEETSEILNGLIRNIEYTSNADVAYDTSLDHGVTGGYGYILVDIDYACEDTFDMDILIKRVLNPLNVWGDPFSTAADSSDWNDSFIADMVREVDFKKQWPNAKCIGFKDAETKYPSWFTENSIRVAEWWHREKVPKTIYKLSNGTVISQEVYLSEVDGIRKADMLQVQGITIADTRETMGYKVTQRIMTAHEILETHEWKGKFIPIIPVYGDEVSVEGKRHFISMVRPAIDAQRNFNYWRSAATELVALAPKTPFIGPKGAFVTDSAKWDTANNANHPYIEYDGAIAPTRQQFAGLPAGALQEAMNASDDMKAIIGIFDAGLGARSNETSGIAIKARKSESDVSTFNFHDNQSRALAHVGRVIVDLVPHVYSVPRVIRIIHEDGKKESVRINEQHPAEPPNQDGRQMGPQAGMVSPQEQKEQQEFQAGVMKLYDLTVGKYDVICKSGPSYATKREESADQMMNLVSAFPNAGPLIGDLIAKNLDWPGADEIADRLKAMLPPQINGENPMITQLRQQLQMMDAHAKEAIGKLSAELAKLKSDNTLENRKLDIDAYSKETDRLKLTSQAMDPAAIQALVLQTIQQLLQSPDVLPPDNPQGFQPNQPPQGGFFTPT